MATIGRTFIDPDKYEQNWFLNLPLEIKYLYMYCWERCDHSGVIEVSLSMWSFHTKLNVTEELVKEMISLANFDKERIVELDSKIWFTEYIRFNQQTDPTKGLSANYSFHKHVFGRLNSHGLVEAINKRDPILLKDFDCLGAVNSNSYKSYVSLSEDLTKQTGKESGKGGGRGTGLGRGSGEGEGYSDYALSQAIAEKIDINYKQNLVSDIQSLANKIKKEIGDERPHEIIDDVLENLKDLTPQYDITFELLKVSVEEKYLVQAC